MRGQGKKSLGLIALLLAAPIPLAFAEDGGAPRTAPPKGDTETSSPTEKPASTAGANGSTSTSGGGQAASTSTSGLATPPHIEGNDDEPDHPPQPPPPKPGPAPVVRAAVVVKDGMARIPGGRFTMGTDDKKAPPNERPSRSVVVPSFWIDKTEVTVGAYRACVDRGACPKPAKSSSACTWEMGDPLLPISCVPWTAAQTYCLALNKRLPREVEWEMAARGTSPIRYPWGGGSAAGCGAAVTLANDATQRSCGNKKPARVGTHPGGASPFGIQDMSGNVEEWVADWYGENGSDLSPRAGSAHVLRGGGWLSIPSSAKTTSRNWGSAREMGPNVGFRCARDD